MQTPPLFHANSTGAAKFAYKCRHGVIEQLAAASAEDETRQCCIGGFCVEEQRNFTWKEHLSNFGEV